LLCYESEGEFDFFGSLEVAEDFDVAKSGEFMVETLGSVEDEDLRLGLQVEFFECRERRASAGSGISAMKFKRPPFAEGAKDGAPGR
jgi:hypothetical protein